MAGKVSLKLQYPDTARDAAVLLVGQILTAINLKQIVAADESFVGPLEKWKERAAVTLSDAMTETR